MTREFPLSRSERITLLTSTSDLKLTSPRQQSHFFALCWTAYCSTYIGRLNFTAGLAQIARSTGFSQTELGMVSSAFFMSYGIFQLVWGVLGDRLNPVRIVFLGVFGSGLCNLAIALCPSPGWMALFWAANGILQSAVWSPLLGLTVSRLPSHEAMTFSVRYSTTVPAGTFAAYALTALCAALGHWQLAFFLAGAILMAIGLIWLRGMGILAPTPVSRAPKAPSANGQRADFRLVLLLFPIVLSAAANGLIRDGLQTWTPSYLLQVHHMDGVSSIMMTLTLPLVNLGGVYLGKRLNDRVFHSEPRTACMCLACAGAALTLPAMGLGLPVWADLGIFALCAALMLAVNTMLVTLIPMGLRRTGMVSALSGLLNSATYVGSTLSGYGVGSLLERRGWTGVIRGGSIAAACAALVCAASIPLWRRATAPAWPKTEHSPPH